MVCDDVVRIDDADVPRFAPQFSVYLHDADVVCLYSEDRKFLLHGEVNCALSAEISKGKRSVRRIVEKLEKELPAADVRGALKRLVDRGYVLRSSEEVDNVAAAYWASLGLSPDVAQSRLRRHTVRIETMDVEGAAELEGALEDLGVRIAKRSPDFTIVLVNDYLDARLEETNLRSIAARRRWTLAQPSGIFPLVGPIFAPGMGACWRCLADRMRRNREVKALLDRTDARLLRASPLATRMVGQCGVQLAAVELAKAIASDFRTDINDHVLSLDLLGSTISKHYIGARPQCPSCGQKRFHDPLRAPAPVELAAGEKVMMTSGGYRSVSSATTVARFRRHVSPLTGVVSRLERIEVDLPLNTNYYAQHNFSGAAESVDELRHGLRSGSFGKGSTAEQGEASALMEAIERYSGIFQGDEIRTTRRLSDFAPEEVISPNDVLLFSEEQLRRGDDPSFGLRDADADRPALFDETANFEWSPIWSLRDGRFKYLPTSMSYFFYRGAAPFSADSNGCASGNSLAEAIVQGFLELVERDAYAIWWYNRLERPALDLGQFDDDYVRELQKQFAATGRRLWVLDATSDLGVPTFVAIAHWMKDGRENVEFGSGAHFDGRIALLRALTELNQFLSLGLMGGGSGDKSSLDGVTPFRLDDHPYLSPSGDRPAQVNLDVKFSEFDTKQQVDACVRLAKEAGCDFLALDQTRPDIGVPVVRVVVPGLRHFYRRFAPGRLYDVPVKSGWRRRPLEECELNPIHPHS